MKASLATLNSKAPQSSRQCSAELNSAVSRCVADFQVGSCSGAAGSPAGLETCDTADLEICATGFAQPAQLTLKISLLLATVFVLLATSSIQAAAPTASAAPERAKPNLVIIGDSTVHNRTRGQLGWGDVIDAWFDSSHITITNRALGGRSSRTFLTEGLWAKALSDLKPGDFVLMQFGHNDGGPLDDGRARASLKGNSDESRVVTNKVSGKVETVHTYGWYMRQYIADAKARKATPIVLSLVPRKIWKDGKVVRAANDYGKWAAEAAKAEGVAFVDLNEIVARHYEELGPEKVDQFFADEHTHTNPDGARLNAQCVIAGIRALKDCGLTQYVLPQPSR